MNFVQKHHNINKRVPIISHRKNMIIHQKNQQICMAHGGSKLEKENYLQDLKKKKNKTIYKRERKKNNTRFFQPEMILPISCILYGLCIGNSDLFNIVN